MDDVRRYKMLKPIGFISKITDKEGIVRESVIYYDKRDNAPIMKWRIPKSECKPENKKIPSILVLEYPKKGFHAHFYTDSSTNEIHADIKNEKKNLRKPIEFNLNVLRNKIMKKKGL